MKKKTREETDREFWETFNLDPMRYALEGLQAEQKYRKKHGLPPVLFPSWDEFGKNDYKFEHKKGSKKCRKRK